MSMYMSLTAREQLLELVPSFHHVYHVSSRYQIWGKHNYPLSHFVIPPPSHPHVSLPCQDWSHARQVQGFGHYSGAGFYANSAPATNGPASTSWSLGTADNSQPQNHSPTGWVCCSQLRLAKGRELNHGTQSHTIKQTSRSLNSDPQVLFVFS